MQRPEEREGEVKRKFYGNHRPTEIRKGIEYQKKSGVLIPVEVEIKPIGHCGLLNQTIWHDEMQCQAFKDKNPNGGRILMPIRCSICEYLA